MGVRSSSAASSDWRMVWLMPLCVLAGAVVSVWSVTSSCALSEARRSFNHWKMFLLLSDCVSSSTTSFSETR